MTYFDHHSCKNGDTPFLQENEHAHFPRVIVCFLIVNSMMLHAQTKKNDTIPHVTLKSPWENVIHFNGYIQKRPQTLTFSDSLKFNGYKTVKRLTVNEFMKFTQPASDKYRKEMEAIYKPLLRVQAEINKNHVNKGLFRYNPNIGYFDTWKEPIELMNPNTEKDRDPDWDGK
ncbi:hypothetical protein [Microbacter margulisiae]|uniref:Uncharacterized protein n=1 Tax=Microbacter margulisiae TaxID=1350067 RepID=A0A7W5H0N6_9PORP|nr:hypothetical protein [Microbacter margulisiae]MBB3186753.1 hypothetical protein [Microbacter margulisiae]